MRIFLNNFIQHLTQLKGLKIRNNSELVPIDNEPEIAFFFRVKSSGCFDVNSRDLLFIAARKQEICVR